MKILYYFAVSVIIATASSRKYDIEEEAKKLYGEDLNAVLLRFRKSSDYMHILEDKTHGIWEQYELICTQIMEYFTKSLKLKVTNSLGYGNVSIFGRMETRLRHHRLKQEKMMKRIRRNDEEESPIETLDHYMYLHRELPTSAINQFKNMGFSTAGQAIDTIIQHIGSEDVSLSSTRLPFGEEDTKTTTDFTHDHQVTEALDPEITTPENPITSKDETLRHPYKKVKP